MTPTDVITRYLDDPKQWAYDERRGQPSASAFPRYDICKGSYQMECEARRLGQVAHIGGKDAERGTRIHAWLAENGPGAIAVPEDKRTILEGQDLDDAMFLDARALEQSQRIFGDGTPVRTLKEKRLWLKTAKSTLNPSGQFDRVTYTEDICLIQNTKTGWREPNPVRMNPQMRVESVLVALALNRAGIQPQRFVVQLVTIPFGVFETTFQWSELRDHYNWIVDILVQLEQPNAALTPHPDACNHCPALLICQAAKDLLAPVTRTRATAIEDAPDKLAETLDQIAVVQDHINEFKAYCERRLLAKESLIGDGTGPFSITGYAMVPGATNRTWTDLEQGMHRLFMEPGVTEKHFAKLKTHTVAAYQKIYAEIYGKKVNDVREAFDKLMYGVIEVKQNKPSLKRVNGTATVKQLE